MNDIIKKFAFGIISQSYKGVADVTTAGFALESGVVVYNGMKFVIGNTGIASVEDAKKIAKERVKEGEKVHELFADFNFWGIPIGKAIAIKNSIKVLVGYIIY